jgi:hypothetical protein
VFSDLKYLRFGGRHQRRVMTARKKAVRMGEPQGGCSFLRSCSGFVTATSAAFGPGAVGIDLAVLGSRIDGLSSARQWALCTRRSRIASAKVGIADDPLHYVRGAIAGALKKKLGLDIIASEKDDKRGRIYRIANAG